MFKCFFFPLFTCLDQQESCQSCMSVEACTTSTEIIIIVTVNFNESLVYPQCELHRKNQLPEVIQLNTCIVFQKSELNKNTNHSIVCPICSDSQYSIVYNIPNSVLSDAVDCFIAGKCCV